MQILMFLLMTTLLADACVQFWTKYVKRPDCDLELCFFAKYTTITFEANSTNFLIKCRGSTLDEDIVRCSDITQIDLLTLDDCTYGDDTNPFSMEKFLNGTEIKMMEMISDSKLKKDLVSVFSNVSTLEFISIKKFYYLLSSISLPVKFGYGMDSLSAIEIIDHNFLFQGTPFDMLRGLRRLTMQNGSVPTIFTSAIVSVPQLEFLDLSWNRVFFVSDHFKRMSNIKELRLTGNNIISTKGLLADLKNLEILYLGFNQIAYLLEIPSTVTELRIHNNNLQELPSVVMEMVDQNPSFKITLAYNKWKCDCETVDWYERNAIKIIDLDEVVCLFVPRNLLIGVVDEGPVIHIFCFHAAQTPFIVLATLLIVFLLVVILWYSMRETIMALLYDKGLLICSCMDEPAHGKVYDVFLCCFETNLSIVEQFIKELEPNLRLCIPERDWPKDARTPSNIAYSIQNSRGTVLFITKNSLQQTWFQVQLRGAYNQRIEDEIHNLILVLGDDIKGVPTKDDIRELIKNEPKMVWGKKFFWEKLRYQLRKPKQVGT